MSYLKRRTQEFRKHLAENYSREELLEIITQQEEGEKIIEGINQIEYVFENKLKHLTWNDGTPITGREFTLEELALLIDEPFRVDEKLTELGLSIEEQKEVHIANDPVIWSRHFLGIKPRVYQILMLRNPSLRKVLRAGRRLGKTTSMTILLLHWAYTHNEARCIVVSPMKAQVEIIYNEMLKLAKNNDAVWSSIVRKVSSPQHTVEFSNGSTIKFFTSGMRSGGKADVVRGQEAHLIVLDELDYMHPDDLIALLAMLQKTSENQDDKVLIGASTPTGAQSVFYEWCTNPEGIDPWFKEFWFPAYANPEWTMEMETELRSQYRSEMAYRHEIEADWGEDTEGVYPRRYIDAAFVGDWKYDKVPKPNLDPSHIYVLGVDWDKYGAGSNIVILELITKSHGDPMQRGKIRLIHREEVPRDEYTLTNAVRRIIELNALFKPAHIYVDRGYGEMQVEMLKKHGTEYPATGLMKKVKGISFSQLVEVRDPSNPSQIDKKEIKPFMVDTLRQILEGQQLECPKSDSELRMQLIAYIVTRKSNVGRPIFGLNSDKVGDHAHDALILACHALNENYGSLLRQRMAKGFKIMDSEVFSPIGQIYAQTADTEEQESIVEEKWGSVNSAPVLVQRNMVLNKVKGTSRPFRRGGV